MKPAVQPGQVRRGLLLCSVLSLAGCAAWPDVWRERWAAWQDRWTPAAQRPLAPALQQQLQALFTQGATALAGNDIDGAIAAWRAYVQAAPPTLPQARRLRGYLTLLQREAAQRFARQAAAQEQAAAFAPNDSLHVALLPLQSQGADADRSPLNRALLAMIAVDLSRAPGVTVLERERIDALLRERRLATSGLVDPATLTASARLLGAGSVVVGAVLNEPGPAGPGSGRYKINTAVSAVGTAAGDGPRVLGAQEADGRQAEFFKLQKDVVYGILQALQVTDIPPAVRRVHTRNWQAYTRFASGLALLGANRFADARAAFLEALALDPDFALAEQALLDVPEQLLTLQQMQADVTAPAR